MFWNDPILYGANLPYKDIPFQPPMMGQLPPWLMQKFIPPTLGFNPYLTPYYTPYVQGGVNPFVPQIPFAPQIQQQPFVPPFQAQPFVPPFQAQPFVPPFQAQPFPPFQAQQPFVPPVHMNLPFYGNYNVPRPVGY